MYVCIPKQTVYHSAAGRIRHKNENANWSIKSLGRRLLISERLVLQQYKSKRIIIAMQEKRLKQLMPVFGQTFHGTGIQICFVVELIRNVADHAYYIRWSYTYVDIIFLSTCMYQLIRNKVTNDFYTSHKYYLYTTGFTKIVSYTQIQHGIALHKCILTTQSVLIYPEAVSDKQRNLFLINFNGNNQISTVANLLNETLYRSIKIAHFRCS